MQRIGIAASRMAQGDLLKYNVFVVGISLLFSTLLFLICEFCFLAVLLIISLVLRRLVPKHFLSESGMLIQTSALWIGILVGVLCIWAIVCNIKISNKSS